MLPGPISHDEQRWAADKREFVEDARDERADERERAADARERIQDAREADVDAREAALDQRERELEERARAIGLLASPSPDRTARQQARTARESAREDRSSTRSNRDEARAERELTTQGRLAGTGPTLLALAFADIATELYSVGTYDEVLTRIAEVAVATVAGGQAASVTLREGGAYRTAGWTAQQAVDVDKEQYDVDEGPCLDALAVAMVDAPGFPDQRWPGLGTRPTDHGVESSVSYRLAVAQHEDPSVAGALNIYGTAPGAFDQAAIDIGTILAAHASLAARAVGERTTLEGIGQQLERALLSRDVIGQAKGILMERLKMTPEDAFDILRHSSQRLNLKLREVAQRLAETGEVDSDHPVI